MLVLVPMLVPVLVPVAVLCLSGLINLVSKTPQNVSPPITSLSTGTISRVRLRLRVQRLQMRERNRRLNKDPFL